MICRSRRQINCWKLCLFKIFTPFFNKLIIKHFTGIRFARIQSDTHLLFLINDKLIMVVPIDFFLLIIILILNSKLSKYSPHISYTQRILTYSLSTANLLMRNNFHKNKWRESYRKNYTVSSAYNGSNVNKYSV